MIDDKALIAKADSGEGLTADEIMRYRQLVKPLKHVYGKYGTLALKYMEEHNVGKLWAIENLPAYRVTGGRAILWKTIAAKRKFSGSSKRKF